MAKKESTFGSMVITLVVITVIAALALGYVHKITEGPIRKAQEEKLKKALKVVLPEFDSYDVKKVKPADGPDSLIFYMAKKGDEAVGTAIQTYTNKGFSGHIDIIAGFRADGSIINTAVLKHSETPGLGDKMDIKKSDFSLQFIDKNPKNYKLKVTKDGGDVDAITASTISSRAFCDAMQRAYDALIQEGGIDE